RNGTTAVLLVCFSVFCFPPVDVIDKDGLILDIVHYYHTLFRCLYRRCPPLPIPNRVVKPARADGLAVTGGRVGRCLILYKGPLSLRRWAFFLCFDHSLCDCLKYFWSRNELIAKKGESKLIPLFNRAD